MDGTAGEQWCVSAVGTTTPTKLLMDYSWLLIYCHAHNVMSILTQNVTKSDKIDLFYLFFFYSQFRQKKKKQARKGTNCGLLSVLTAVILVFLQLFCQRLIAK